MNIGDVVMVHRYLYYVINNPVILDYEYDVLEKCAKMIENDKHPINYPGSDLEDSYPQYIKDKAITLIDEKYR